MATCAQTQRSPPQLMNDGLIDFEGGTPPSAKCLTPVLPMGRIITTSNNMSSDITPFWKPLKKESNVRILQPRRFGSGMSVGLPTLDDDLPPPRETVMLESDPSRPIITASLCPRILLPDASLPNLSGFKLKPRKSTRRALFDLSIHVPKRPRNDGGDASFVSLDQGIDRVTDDNDVKQESSSSTDESDEATCTNKPLLVTHDDAATAPVPILTKPPAGSIPVAPSSSLVSKPQAVRPWARRDVYQNGIDPSQETASFLSFSNSSAFLPKS